MKKKGVCEDLFPNLIHTVDMLIDDRVTLSITLFPASLVS